MCPLVLKHEALGHEKSNGLTEIAVSGGSAAARLGHGVGRAVEVLVN